MRPAPPPVIGLKSTLHDGIRTSRRDEPHQFAQRGRGEPPSVVPGKSLSTQFGMRVRTPGKWTRSAVRLPIRLRMNAELRISLCYCRCPSNIVRAARPLKGVVVMGQFPKFSTPVEKTVENTPVYAVERRRTPIFRVFRRGERLYDARSGRVRAS